MALSIFAAAAEAPDHPALIADGRTLDYAALAARARTAVGWLRSRELDDAPLVALDATSSAATIEMLHALMALGVPALLLHPRLTEPERRAILDEAAPAGVIGEGWRDESRGRTAEPAGATEPNGAPAAAGPDPDPPPDDERPLAIVYTSGSTGRPRGVVLSRRAFVASATASAANLGWRDDDRWLLRLPVAHVGGLSVVTRCLLARRTVVLAPDDRDDRDGPVGAGAPGGAAALVETLERERVTVVSLVPTLLGRILALDPPVAPPAHLRAVLLGGAAAAPALLERAAERGWPVLTTYGLTEACSQVTTQEYGTVNRGELGAGRPLPGTEVRVDDDGEILVRGPTLMTGYLAPGGLDRPFREGGWLATGDHGRLDDRGNLHVAGRRADRIVTGGENVDPVEVEQALERLPDVRQACVFGMPDPEWGEVVCAAVVAEGSTEGSGDEALDLARVRAELAAVLAPFKLPRRVAVLDALPTRGAGKVDRSAVARAAVGRLREA